MAGSLSTRLRSIRNGMRMDRMNTPRPRQFEKSVCGKDLVVATNDGPGNYQLQPGATRVTPFKPDSFSEKSESSSPSSPRVTWAGRPDGRLVAPQTGVPKN